MCSVSQGSSTHRPVSNTYCVIGQRTIWVSRDVLARTNFVLASRETHIFLTKLLTFFFLPHSSSRPGWPDKNFSTINVYWPHIKVLIRLKLLSSLMFSVSKCSWCKADVEWWWSAQFLPESLWPVFHVSGFGWSRCGLSAENTRVYINKTDFSANTNVSRGRRRGLLLLSGCCHSPGALRRCPGKPRASHRPDRSQTETEKQTTTTVLDMRLMLHSCSHLIVRVFNSTLSPPLFLLHRNLETGCG